MANLLQNGPKPARKHENLETHGRDVFKTMVQRLARSFGTDRQTGRQTNRQINK